jgi:transcriptional regulator with XRE-family HTH domain
MTVGLAAQISSIVRQHLADAHRMLGALLAQLDAAGEVDLGGRAATPELVKPAIAASSPKPSTIERRARLVRAKQRQAAATAATGETAAPAGPWPVLRTEFHAAIKARHLSRSQIAHSLNVSKGSVCGWLAPNGAPPSAANITAIRAWLDKPAPKTQTQTPAALGGWSQLRQRMRDIVRERALSHADIAGVIGVEPGTVGTWLAKSHEDRTPGARFLLKIEQ